VKGDTLNSTRALSLRLSISFAITTLLALYIYLAGNFGKLTDEALLVAVRVSGGAGIITIIFGLVCVALSFLSKAQGSRLHVLSIVLGVLMSVIGLTGAVVSAFLQVVSGGMSL